MVEESGRVIVKLPMDMGASDIIAFFDNVSDLRLWNNIRVEYFSNTNDTKDKIANFEKVLKVIKDFNLDKEFSVSVDFNQYDIDLYQSYRTDLEHEYYIKLIFHISYHDKKYYLGIRFNVSWYKTELYSDSIELDSSIISKTINNMFLTMLNKMQGEINMYEKALNYLQYTDLSNSYFKDKKENMEIAYQNVKYIYDNYISINAIVEKAVKDIEAGKNESS